MQSLSRCGVALLFAVFVAGCSSPASVADRTNECTWNRSSCIHEGSYEPDEREYAEKEARRLNRAQSARLRGWFW